MNADRRRQQYTQDGKGSVRMRDCNGRGQKYKSNKHVMPVNSGSTFSRTISSPCHLRFYLPDRRIYFISQLRKCPQGKLSFELPFKAEGQHGATWQTMTACKLDVGKLAMCSTVQNTTFSIRASHSPATGAAQRKAKGESGEDSHFSTSHNQLQGKYDDESLWKKNAWA